MKFKLLSTILCTLVLSSTAYAKTTYKHEYAGGMLGGSYIGIRVVVDTCVIVAITFEQKSRFEYQPTWSCVDFDDPQQIMYTWVSKITDKAGVEDIKNDKVLNTVQHFEFVAFKAHPNKINFKNLYSVTTKYRTTLAQLEKDENKKMKKGPYIDAREFANAEVNYPNKSNSNEARLSYVGGSRRTKAGLSQRSSTSSSQQTPVATKKFDDSINQNSSNAPTW